jgi:adenylyl-sulfate kinase
MSDKAKTIIFTGLSGSGKTTISEAVKRETDLVLDGDILRKGISSDLGFSDSDRIENNRRLIEICKLFNSTGKTVIVAFIFPFEFMREMAKSKLEECYIVHCNASLEVCEKRDVKGIYAKARSGEIKKFTGIDSPYEIPVSPDLILETGEKSIKECVSKVD